MLVKAIQIAVSAHKEQVDKSGQPYILHLIRVMDAGETEIKVKLNDLRDNMDITRLVHITKKDRERLNKYLKAYQELKACL